MINLGQEDDNDGVDDDDEAEEEEEEVTNTNQYYRGCQISKIITANFYIWKSYMPISKI